MQPSLLLSGLNDGTAEVGDTLSASLSDGTAITSYAWGSTPGGADYGTASTLSVPEAAAGSILYLEVESAAGPFATAVPVAAAPVVITVLSERADAIRIESLAPVPARPSLTAGPDTDAITVEIS
ncbi:hypothetical protein [uncultured Roseobacter sp.]|uniref:hypothetical protein n=1 Tax=uncultured Roseobacter sp. TaxID=114847 RepID=UPI002607A54F|nr:hypothetical protein [uncultured Roseobacter sp.]